MSNARSPREVCSTTIGTRGLIGRSVYKGRSARRSSLRRPEARPLALPLLLPGSPELLARDRLLLGDRLRRFRDQVDRLAQAQVLAKDRVAPAAAQALEQPFRGLLALAGPERLEHLLLCDLDPLCLDHRRQGRLAAQGSLGVRLQVGD